MSNEQSWSYCQTHHMEKSLKSKGQIMEQSTKLDQPSSGSRPTLNQNSSKHRANFGAWRRANSFWEYSVGKPEYAK